jgi:hypothetical protein
MELHKMNNGNQKRHRKSVRQNEKIKIKNNE